jgi:hypothetical protein
LTNATVAFSTPPLRLCGIRHVFSPGFGGMPSGVTREKFNARRDVMETEAANALII